MSAALRVRDLSIDLRREGRWVRVLDRITLEAAAGRVLGLVGESGCGKTVMGLSLMGLLDAAASRVATGSSVELHGRELLGLSRRDLDRTRCRDIAMVFQEPMTSLNPAFTIGEQVAEALRIHMGMNRRAAKVRSIELLAAVGIANPARAWHAYPHAFSGGMRQRALIAMAVSCEPKVLIADEPTTALDVTIQAQILELLRKLRDELDLTVILITHDLGVVADFCDDVAVMYAGQIVESNDAVGLFSAPGHPYTEGLLASMPVMGAANLRVIPGRVPLPEHFDAGCRFRFRCPYAAPSCDSPPIVAVHRGTKVARCHRRDELRLEGVGEAA